MTEIHEDGLGEHLRGGLQLAVTVAARVGEQVARQREQARREAEAQSVQATREMESRLQAQWAAERPELTRTRGAEWWDKASDEQIARSYQVAAAWAGREPEAADYQREMAQTLRDRFGVDVTATGLDDPEVLAKARAARDEEREAAKLTAAADATDAAAEATEATPGGDAEAAAGHAEAEADRLDAGQHYDSADRRDAQAAQLVAAGVDPGAVEQRRIADQHQAAPASDAVRGAGRRPRVKTVGAGRTRQRGRQDRGR